MIQLQIMDYEKQDFRYTCLKQITGPTRSSSCELSVKQQIPLHQHLVNTSSPLCSSKRVHKDDEEVECFYERIKDVLKQTKLKDATIVMVDLNNKAGQDKVENYVGNHQKIIKSTEAYPGAYDVLNHNTAIAKVKIKLKELKDKQNTENMGVRNLNNKAI